MKSGCTGPEIVVKSDWNSQFRPGDTAMRAAGEKAFFFEGYTLDMRRGSVCAGDRDLALRPKSFNVLCYLVANAGRLIPKDELAKAVWPDISVTDESVTRCVSDVRQALDDADKLIIKTVLGRGYMFIAPISEPNEDDGAAAPRPKERAAEALSLVIIPFTNLGGDPAQNRLADALTEGLTTYLSRMPDTVVVTRSGAPTYGRGPLDVRRVGQKLGVRYVLEGSQQHGGTRMRVSARLVDARTGAHLWADQFDAPLTDLLDMQDDIVTRLARTIHIELSALEAARISRERATGDDADDLARRGEAIFLRYGPNRDEADAGYELCERALAVDSQNVRALSILAEKFATRVTASQSIDRDADVRRAAELVSRALASEPNSHHAHFAKARLLLAQGRPEQALVEAERSLALNPSFIPTYHVLSLANLQLARPDQALEYADKAMRLSPLDPYRYFFCALKGYGHIMRDERGRAIECLRQAVANNPEFPTPIAWLAATLALAGQQEDARAMLKRYLTLSGTKSRTIAQFKSLARTDHPGYLTYRDQFYEGLRKAGMPEE
jgi:TolB-like protein/Flp pilus assembly protein TadD